jgi:hypothetical protein
VKNRSNSPSYDFYEVGFDGTIIPQSEIENAEFSAREEPK